MISLVSLLVLLSQASFDRVRQAGNSIVFEMQTAADSLYVLDESGSITEDWQESRLVAGNGATAVLTNEAAGAARFFRARILPGRFTSKPGTPLNVSLALSNASSALWTVEGELPEGVVFTNGIFSGMPTSSAAEKYPSGNYTNLVRLAANSQISSAEVVHHLKFSFSRNIFAERPNGPSFGTICIKCHGSGFPPDFTPSAATLLVEKPESEGTPCHDPWAYILPGDLANSLIYRKLIAPPCGDRMPQGGPYFSEEQINRVARWIAELQPGETD